MFFVFILFVLFAAPSVALADVSVNLQAVLADTASLPDIAPVTPEDVGRFYALRSYHPAWSLSEEGAEKKTRSFIDSASALIAYHGLDEKSYPLESMRKLAPSQTEADRQRLEVLITASLLHLAQDLHGDDVDLAVLYPGWNFHRAAADLPALLNAAIEQGKLGALFDKLTPQNAPYRALAKALVVYRALEAKGGWPAVALGAALRPGDRTPRVAQLRARLAAEGYIAATKTDGAGRGLGDLFDGELESALVAYQTRNGLQPDGHAGAKTQEALNVPVAGRIAQIRANMERWRHMPEDFPPDRYTLVNIPDFTVMIVEGGASVYLGKVVDGRTDRPTPFVNSRIVDMLVNPSWHVPTSIARKDILPKLRKDPHYLEDQGIVIAGREEDPSGVTIDWTRMSAKAFTYKLRQIPSDINSLGQLKFNFASPLGVYMHGTPHQELFDKAERNFSSGCVRLEDPVRFGEILLAANKDKGGWDQQRILDEIATEKTRVVPLAKSMPLYFLYESVFEDSDGQVNFRKDIYSYDALLMDWIKGVGAE